MNPDNFLRPDADPWLSAWLPTLAEYVQGAAILELGCGDGWDTEKLLKLGAPVVALERNAQALANARARAPNAEYFERDLLAPFPVADGSVGVVLASLSLHYFGWSDTCELITRIHPKNRSYPMPFA